MDLKLYSREWCSWCIDAKEYLSDRGYKFTEIDVGQDREAYEEMKEFVDAGDQRSDEALDTHHRIDARPSNRGADIGRSSHARFDGQPRNACHHGGAMFEEVVGEAEVAVIADERRAEKSRVRVIARVRDSEGDFIKQR